MKNVFKTPPSADLTKRQRSINSVARASALRRDRLRRTNSPSLNSPERKFKRRESLTGAARRRTETKYGFQRPIIGRPREAEATKPAPEFMHGYASQVTWSQELDDIEAPTLKKAEIHDLVEFRVKWIEYAERIQDFSDRHNVNLTPKSIYDCIEKYNRYYICAISELLPVEARGHPDDVSAQALHDLIMESVNKQCDRHTTRLSTAISKIHINLNGSGGKASIHAAWMELFRLQDVYKTEAEPKVVIKKLLANLTPVKTRNIIKGLQDTGTEEQKRTKSDMLAFHQLLVKIAEAHKMSIDYGM